MSDFWFGIFIGLSLGLVVGGYVGIEHFRRGIEDGMKLHGLIREQDSL